MKDSFSLGKRTLRLRLIKVTRVCYSINGVFYNDDFSKQEILNLALSDKSLLEKGLKKILLPQKNEENLETSFLKKAEIYAVKKNRARPLNIENLVNKRFTTTQDLNKETLEKTFNLCLEKLIEEVSNLSNYDIRLNRLSIARIF
ncbi:MAG: hypothetical protein QXX30_00650 [Candidatus Aenigmatarchaeota archaeon]